MIPEDERARRGEPVIVVQGGGERLGTIEWGGVTKPASVYFESGGRDARVAIGDLRADPGGNRPVWRKVTNS